MPDNYTIKKKLDVLMADDKGHTKEVNIISWYGKEAGLDIRRWSKNHEPGRGIVLSMEEASKLKEILDTYIK